MGFFEHQSFTLLKSSEENGKANKEVKKKNLIISDNIHILLHQELCIFKNSHKSSIPR